MFFDMDRPGYVTGSRDCLVKMVHYDRMEEQTEYLFKSNQRDALTKIAATISV